MSRQRAGRLWPPEPVDDPGTLNPDNRSGPAAARRAEMAYEKIITTLADPDLGQLELVEYTRGNSPVRYYEWRGETRSADGQACRVYVMATKASTKPDVGEQARRLLKRWLGDIPGTQRRLAALMLEEAQEWAEERGMGNNLTLSRFAAGLELEGIALSGDASCELRFADATGVFDHGVIRAEIDANGEITDTGLEA